MVRCWAIAMPYCNHRLAGGVGSNEHVLILLKVCNRLLLKVIKLERILDGHLRHQLTEIGMSAPPGSAQTVSSAVASVAFSRLWNAAIPDSTASRSIHLQPRLPSSVWRRRCRGAPAALSAGVIGRGVATAGATFGTALLAVALSSSNSRPSRRHRRRRRLSSGPPSSLPQGRRWRGDAAGDPAAFATTSRLASAISRPASSHKKWPCSGP